MLDRHLTVTENNIIDSVRKLASYGVKHNFNKNKEIIAFNSLYANDLFRSITEKEDAKVSCNDIFLAQNYSIPPSSSMFETVSSWLDSSCCGYYVLVDTNVFFEKEEDKVSFILKFSSN